MINTSSFHGLYISCKLARVDIIVRVGLLAKGELLVSILLLRFKIINDELSMCAILRWEREVKRKIWRVKMGK